MFKTNLGRKRAISGMYVTRKTTGRWPRRESLSVGPMIRVKEAPPTPLAHEQEGSRMAGSHCRARGWFQRSRRNESDAPRSAARPARGRQRRGCRLRHRRTSHANEQQQDVDHEQDDVLVLREPQHRFGELARHVVEDHDPAKVEEEKQNDDECAGLYHRSNDGGRPASEHRGYDRPGNQPATCRRRSRQPPPWA